MVGDLPLAIGQDDMTELSSEAEAIAILDAVRAKRGYLLPHHGLLALTAPRLARAYDEAYTALTLDTRSLSEFEKEFVWLPILISTDEAIATHHIAKFKAAGGTTRDVETCLRLAAFARGAAAEIRGCTSCCALVAAVGAPSANDVERFVVFNQNEFSCYSCELLSIF